MVKRVLPLLCWSGKQLSLDLWAMTGALSQRGGALMAMKHIEKCFERKCKHPWTFLSDEPFMKDFIKQTTNWVSSKVLIG